MSVLENLEMGAYQRDDKPGIREDLDRVYDLFPRLQERRMQRRDALRRRAADARDRSRPSWRARSSFSSTSRPWGWRRSSSTKSSRSSWRSTAKARRSCSSSRTRSWRSTQQAGDTFSRPGRSPWRTTRRRCARTSRFARRISARTGPLKEVLADIERWRGRGDRVALATVVATRRSAPRPVGAKLAVSSSGEITGSVSGGCVEHEVYEEAKDVLANGTTKLVTRHLGRAGLGRRTSLRRGDRRPPTPLDDDILTRSKDAYATEQRAAVVMPLEDGAPTFVREGA